MYMNIEENVTFSGKEAVKLDSKTLEESIKLLGNGFNESKIARVTYNGEQSRFLRALNISETVTKKDEVLFSYCGIPVFTGKYVPLNEVWLQDKNGKVIEKFKI